MNKLEKDEDMNKQAIFHKQDSKYCFPTALNKLVLRLQVDREDVFDKIEVFYGCKYTISQGHETKKMEVKYVDNLYAHYEIELELTDVRICYVFGIYEEGRLYYFSEDGITDTYNFNLSYYNSFQMPYIHQKDLHEYIPWLEDRVFYQIFVERFALGDENKEKDYITLNWGDIPNPKSFAGGDIAGIIKNLEYIKNLGVNAIYLTPVFQAISNHKYDISDYYTVDSQFGDNEILKVLIQEAHNMGIKIVLDAVFNHCSKLLPQFMDVVEHGKNSKYHDWFMIRGDYPNMQELNYEVFAFCHYMPKFNTANKEVEAYLLDIATYWIKEYDIDGWRLDVSDEISHDFWRAFRKAVKAVKSDIIIIGENWHDSNAYLMGDQFDSIMNYAFTKACLDYFAFNSLDGKGVTNKLNHLLTRNTNQVNHMMLNLLDSHDTDRFYTSVHKNKEKVLSALAVLMLYPGVPCIYYGTEIFLEGGYDPDNRRCFDWNESNWNVEYMNIIKKLFALKTEGILKVDNTSIKEEDELLYIYRENSSYKVILAVNQTETKKQITTQGEVFASIHYESEVLLQDGFVIFITKKE